MARRRSSNRRMPTGKRVIIPNANRFRLLAPNVSPVDLRVFEDRRTFYPDPLRPAGVTSRRSFRRVVVRPVRADRTRDVFRFAVPDRVLVCIRRKQRREVLHALNRTRSGRGGRKRRNQWSDVSCRG